MDKNAFSERLLKLRREKGLSQKELGELLGVSNKAISKWENGEAMPKTETMLKLAELLEIDGNELLGIYSAPVSEEKFTDELDRLKSENIALQERIASQNKNNKRYILWAGIFLACVLLIIATVTLINQTGGYNNPELSNVGQTGSRIEFNNTEYMPCNETQNGLLEFNKDIFYYSLDQRNAKYLSDDNSAKNITVESHTEYKFLRLKTKQGTYYYVDKDLSLEITPNNLNSVSIDYGTISNNNNYRMTGFFEHYVSGTDKADSKIKSFCDFYNSLDNSAEKRITELYLGNNSKVVTVNYKERYLPELKVGEFFEDNNKELYFYNYANAQSYFAGEELREFVN